VKKKLEIQTIVILLCALGIAASWIGIQVAKDSLGGWTEPYEFHFTANDLLGLGPRSELRCAGAVIGHVRKVTSGITPDGVPQFMIVAGIGRDFSAWPYAPHGIVMFSVVQSALSPSWINLDLDSKPDAVRPREPKDGPPPVLPLEREQSKADLDEIEGRVNQVISQLTEPQNGNSLSAINELAQVIHHLDGVAASLDGQPLSTGTNPATPSPLDRLVLNLDASTGNLKNMTASLDKTVGQGGELDHTLTTLTDSLLRIQKLTDEMTKTIDRLNLKIDVTIGKMNGVLDETAGTMTTLQEKADRLGDTFVGRMLIAKPGKKSTPAPTPEKATHPSH
jgi:ABC-type transporter Mla subunit MlaD